VPYGRAAVHAFSPGLPTKPRKFTNIIEIKAFYMII